MVAVINLQVAVGVGIEVKLARGGRVDHDRHPRRAGAAKPDPSIAPAGRFAAVGHLFDQLFRFVAAQDQGAKRGMVEWVAGPGDDITPGRRRFAVQFIAGKRARESGATATVVIVIGYTPLSKISFRAAENHVQSRHILRHRCS